MAKGKQKFVKFRQAKQNLFFLELKTKKIIKTWTLG